MEVTKVKEAARLLDQYEKLNKFLRESPDNAETMTFTLRKGKDSKSLTLKAQPLVGFNVVTVASDLMEETLDELRKLGVEV